MNNCQSDLDGKVAIVTGAARGLGAAVAAALSASGVRVMLTDLLEKEGLETAAGLKNSAFLKHNVVSESDWQAVVDKTVETFGGLDIIVNNAGVESASLFADCELAEFKRIQSVNVDGTFLGIKWGIRAMRPGGGAGKGGAIVNLSSVAGLVGVPGLGAYCAAKGGVRLLSKAAAVECARLGYGIRVNSIHPAIIKTKMGLDVIQSFVDIGLAENEEAVEAAMANLHPMGYGDTSDVANAVCYLASSAAKWVTGAELAIDGGFTAC